MVAEFDIGSMDPARSFGGGLGHKRHQATDAAARVCHSADGVLVQDVRPEEQDICHIEFTAAVHGAHIPRGVQGVRPGLQS